MDIVLLPQEVYQPVYPSYLSFEQLQQMLSLLPPSPPLGTDRTVDLRKILNGILYVVRTGCQWRMLPKEDEHWNTTYGYFRRWCQDGTWQRIHDLLREQTRLEAGREPTPSAAILDSQSVKPLKKRASRLRCGQKDQRSETAYFS